MLDKKAMLESTLGKVVFGLILIIVVLGLIMAFTGTLHEIWAGFINIFRFGG